MRARIKPWKNSDIRVKNPRSACWPRIGEPDEEGWITLSLLMDTDLLAKMLVFGLAGFVEILERPALKGAVLAQALQVIRDLEP